MHKKKGEKKRLRIGCCRIPRDAGRNGKIERLRFNDLCKFLAFLTFSALGGKKRERAPVVSGVQKVSRHFEHAGGLYRRGQSRKRRT